MAGTARDGRKFDDTFEEGAQERNGRDAWDGASCEPPAWQDSDTGLFDSAASELDPPSAWLVHAIENEIIPRLMLAHREPALKLVPRGHNVKGPGSEDVVAFAALLLKRHPDEAVAYVDSMRERGVALELIYLDLLSPTARRLGELWDSDDCQFTDVTVGLWRLQQVMYDMSPEFQRGAANRVGSRRALLAPAPGSQHTLGLFMVAEFFRRAGWHVLGRPDASRSELLSTARNEWFDVVGLSVGTELHIDGLSAVIAELRKVSVNPDIAVLVGGPLFVAEPELYIQVGADATASDAPHAVTQAESLVAAREARDALHIDDNAGPQASL